MTYLSTHKHNLLLTNKLVVDTMLNYLDILIHYKQIKFPNLSKQSFPRIHSPNNKRRI